jgi:hypothetical protein
MHDSKIYDLKINDLKMNEIKIREIRTAYCVQIPTLLSEAYFNVGMIYCQKCHSH